jgi:hypothetical protein
MGALEVMVGFLHVWSSSSPKGNANFQGVRALLIFYIQFTTSTIDITP